MAREKKTKSKVYPSQVKYRQENPVIGIRLTRSLREILDSLRGDTSYSEFIRTVLTTKEKQLEKISSQAHKKGYEEGYKKGYEEAVKKYRITFTCEYCNEEIPIIGEEAQSVARKAVVNAGFKHKDCPKRVYKPNAKIEMWRFQPGFPIPYPQLRPPFF